MLHPNDSEHDEKCRLDLNIISIGCIWLLVNGGNKPQKADMVHAYDLHGVVNLS